jgi:hypothetical protein
MQIADSTMPVLRRFGMAASTTPTKRNVVAETAKGISDLELVPAMNDCGLALMVTVIFALSFPVASKVAGDGENAQPTPLVACPLTEVAHARFTLSLKPLTDATLMSNTADCPTLSVAVVGAMLALPKSPTCRVAPIVCEIEPTEPTTLNGKSPIGTLFVTTEKFSAVLPAKLGAILQAAPAGSPVQENWTEPPPWLIDCTSTRKNCSPVGRAGPAVENAFRAKSPT